jgi:hypothetical protein
MAIKQQADPSAGQVRESAPTSKRSREVRAGIVQVAAGWPIHYRGHDDRRA